MVGAPNGKVFADSGKCFFKIQPLRSRLPDDIFTIKGQLAAGYIGCAFDAVAGRSRRSVPAFFGL